MYNKCWVKAEWWAICHFQSLSFPVNTCCSFCVLCVCFYFPFFCTPQWEPSHPEQTLLFGCLYLHSRHLSARLITPPCGCRNCKKKKKKEKKLYKGNASGVQRAFCPRKTRTWKSRCVPVMQMQSGTVNCLRGSLSSFLCAQVTCHCCLTC